MEDSTAIYEINFVHKHMFYIVQFFHTEGMSAERCELYHIWISVRQTRGGDGGRRLTGDSTSMWFSTLVLLWHEQSVVVVRLQATQRLHASWQSLSLRYPHVSCQHVM